MRGNEIREWSGLGKFETMNLAARSVLERRPIALGAIFVRVYVGSTRKAESITRCRAITRSPPASPRAARIIFSGPHPDTATVLLDEPMAQPDAWRMIRRRHPRADRQS
jgi:hypothetical protein